MKVHVALHGESTFIVILLIINVTATPGVLTALVMNHPKLLQTLF